MTAPISESCGAKVDDSLTYGEVRVLIQYCEIGNYSGVAQELGRAIRAEFTGLPVEIEMSSSSGGVFEVSVNQRLIFSKKATFRLPSDAEIFYHIQAALAHPSLAPSHRSYQGS
jgi:selT/selW/selH-like putative selenoprotein